MLSDGAGKSHRIGTRPTPAGGILPQFVARRRQTPQLAHLPRYPLVEVTKLVRPCLYMLLDGGRQNAILTRRRRRQDITPQHVLTKLAQVSNLLHRALFALELGLRPEEVFLTLAQRRERRQHHEQRILVAIRPLALVRRPASRVHLSSYPHPAAQASRRNTLRSQRRRQLELAPPCAVGERQRAPHLRRSVAIKSGVLRRTDSVLAAVPVTRARAHLRRHVQALPAPDIVTAQGGGTGTGLLQRISVKREACYLSGGGEIDFDAQARGAGIAALTTTHTTAIKNLPTECHTIASKTAQSISATDIAYIKCLGPVWHAFAVSTS